MGPSVTRKKGQRKMNASLSRLQEALFIPCTSSFRTLSLRHDGGSSNTQMKGMVTQEQRQIESEPE